MKIIEVTEKNMQAFQPLLTERMQAQFQLMEDIFVLGATLEDTAVGVIALQLCEDAGVDILYLFVSPKYRRNRIATELVYSAAMVCEQLEGVVGIRFSYCETIADESGLIPFFRFCEFDMEESKEQITYYCTIGELDGIQLFKKSFEEKGIPYQGMNSHERKLLRLEPIEMVSVAMDMEAMEPDISLCTLENGEISNCVLFVEQNDDLLLIWARSAGNGQRFLSLLVQAIRIAKTKYDSSKKIIIPAINEISSTLCKKILGNHAKPMEKNYLGSFLLGGEIEEEFEL